MSKENIKQRKQVKSSQVITLDLHNLLISNMTFIAELGHIRTSLRTTTKKSIINFLTNTHLYIVILKMINKQFRGKKLETSTRLDIKGAIRFLIYDLRPKP